MLIVVRCHMRLMGEETIKSTPPTFLLILFALRASFKLQSCCLTLLGWHFFIFNRQQMVNIQLPRHFPQSLLHN